MGFCEDIMEFENNDSKGMYSKLMNHAESIMVEIFRAKYAAHATAPSGGATISQVDWLIRSVASSSAGATISQVDWLRRLHAMISQVDWLSSSVASSSGGATIPQVDQLAGCFVPWLLLPVGQRSQKSIGCEDCMQRSHKSIGWMLCSVASSSGGATARSHK